MPDDLYTRRLTHYVNDPLIQLDHARCPSLLFGSREMPKLFLYIDPMAECLKRIVGSTWGNYRACRPSTDPLASVINQRIEFDIDFQDLLR